MGRLLSGDKKEKCKVAGLLVELWPQYCQRVHIEDIVGGAKQYSKYFGTRVKVHRKRMRKGSCGRLGYVTARK